LNTPIGKWLCIQHRSITGSMQHAMPTEPWETVEDLYRVWGCSYPKFFKMDLLSKWAWLAAEKLLTADAVQYEGIDKNKIAVVLMTSEGCMEVDKRYRETITEIASPALFVYTLPNIMLGEVCIRHGFKGEQACLVDDVFDTDQMGFWVNDYLSNRDMEACLCGWVNVKDGEPDVCLYWITRKAFTTSGHVDMWKLRK